MSRAAREAIINDVTKATSEVDGLLGYFGEPFGSSHVEMRLKITHTKGTRTMATNKEFNQRANQLSLLAKFYLAHLAGTPAEKARKEKSFHGFVLKLHKQLREKGTSLVRGASNVKSFDGAACPSGMYQCTDGTCVQSADCCDGSAGLLAPSAAKAKPTAKKAAKKASKKK